MRLKNLTKRIIRKISFLNLKKRNLKLKKLYDFLSISKINIFDIGAGQRILPEIINFDGISRVNLIDPNKNLEYSYNQLKKYFLDHNNIHKFNLGISDRTKSLPYYEGKISTGSSFALNNREFKKYNKKYFKPKKLKVYNFKDFLKLKNLSKPDIIKIDVEGLEFKVLKSILTYSDPFLIQIETNINNPIFSESFYKINELLIKKGYSLYTLYPSYGYFDKDKNQMVIDNKINLNDIEINFKKNYLLQAECYYLKEIKKYNIKHYLILLGFGLVCRFKEIEGLTPDANAPTPL